MNRFFMCKIQVQELWSSLFCLVGVSWVLLYSMFGFWKEHLGERSLGGISKVVNVLPLERKKCSLLLGERAAHDEVDVLIFQD